ncbi:hypothetical protein A3860_16320 [Niastella vici]|uniref:Uncharacterized protein n=1 Tax=Niastella vici TaxID=1703345 RepID=A0A1V9G3V9_9BACT|nr:hypothetical protein A3860_16320 [Niastella vici]
MILGMAGLGWGGWPGNDWGQRGVGDAAKAGINGGLAWKVADGQGMIRDRGVWAMRRKLESTEAWLRKWEMAGTDIYGRAQIKKRVHQKRYTLLSCKGGENLFLTLLWQQHIQGARLQ